MLSGHLEYVKTNLWSFGNFVVIWYFSPRWFVVPRKIWQPCYPLPAVDLNI
jgi:hypothetical protein